MNRVKTVFVGIGGYGMTYVTRLLDAPDPRIEPVGFIDPYPERCPRLDEVRALGAPFFASLEDFYAAGHAADLAVISTPIALHTPNILTALGNGSNVLCEKPLCGDEADIPRIIEARDRAGKFVRIGYQWSFSEAVGSLKRDVLSGMLGRPVDFKTLILWPRDENYYSRGTGWAGRVKLDNGALVYDSVASNAAAHYLHNMLFIAGAENRAAEPVDVRAMLLRANPIENFDTTKIDMTLESGAELHFLAAHTTKEVIDPIFAYRFEKATVCFAQKRTPLTESLMPAAYDSYGHIVALCDNGSCIDYGDPFADVTRKLTLAVDAVLNGGGDVCGVEAAAAHTRVINRIQRENIVRDVRPELIWKENGFTRVEGLGAAMMDAYANTDRSIDGFAKDDRGPVGVGLYGLNGHQIHGKAPKMPDGVVVAAACMPEKALDACRNEHLKVYDSLEELLADERVELVSICSPRREQQEADIIACLRAGKHVYAEKPAVLDEAALDRVLAVAREVGKEFHEMADTVFYDPYATARRLVREGAVGTVVQVYAQKSYPDGSRGSGRPTDETTDGGLIRWVGVHAVRFIEHITGIRVDNVRAFETRLGGPGYFSAASLAMTLENGGVASVCMNYLNPYSFGSWGNESVRVFGTKGMLEITDGGAHINLFSDGHHGAVELPGQPPADFLAMLLAHLRRGAPMPMGSEAELHPLRVVIRAKEAAAQEAMDAAELEI